MAQRRFVVIGDGAAGLSAAEELRRHDPTASIGVFTEEPTPSYFRAALTNFLLGELREESIVLMQEGRIVQKGTLDDLRDRPAHPFVSEFMNAQRSLVAL